MNSNLPLSEQIGRAYMEFANKNYQADLLEELKSSVKSELIGRELEDDPKLSFAKAEQRVLAGDEWKQHVHGQVEARRLANIARAKIKQLEAMASEQMSAAADARTQARL